MAEQQHEVMELVEIVSNPLEITRYIDAVRDPRAGAIATFAGTTRNSFQGREVIELEYEAYVSMAERQMKAICKSAHARWPLIAISAAHRIGVVPIGHESVFVAASSVHRADALLACHFIIDEIKASVPIWKKEVYLDGKVWKENAEFFAREDRLHHAHDVGSQAASDDLQKCNNNVTEEEDSPASSLCTACYQKRGFGEILAENTKGIRACALIPCEEWQWKT